MLDLHRKSRFSLSIFGIQFPRFHKLFVLQKQFCFHLVCLGESSLVFIVKKIRASFREFSGPLHGNVDITTLHSTKIQLICKWVWYEFEWKLSSSDKEAHRYILFASFWMDSDWQMQWPCWDVRVLFYVKDIIDFYEKWWLKEFKNMCYAIVAQGILNYSTVPLLFTIALWFSTFPHHIINEGNLVSRKCGWKKWTDKFWSISPDDFFYHFIRMSFYIWFSYMVLLCNILLLEVNTKNF